MNTPFQPSNNAIFWQNRFAGSNNLVVPPGYVTPGSPEYLPHYSNVDVYTQRVGATVGFDPRDVNYRAPNISRREFVPLYGNRTNCYATQKYNTGFQQSTRLMRVPCPWEVSMRFP